MRTQSPAILGILNLAPDSFSDGGRFLDPGIAVDHGLRLRSEGADWIDVGAESTHPDSADVPVEEEIRRLSKVVPALVAQGVRVSVDTRKTATMQAAIEFGAGMINDVKGLRDAGAAALIARTGVQAVLMHARSATGRAERGHPAPARVMDEALSFLRARLDETLQAGVRPEQLIVDPGMGLFVSPRSRDSFALLRELGRLRALGFPVLISVSRKGFLASAFSSRSPPPPVERGPATLAAELWAAASGVDYVRTHDVRALREALAVWRAIEAAQ